MKNTFKIQSSQHGATCGLCQDTLLRHISQSRVFWYCPSCRQETVCEEQEPLEPILTTTGISTVVSSKRKLTKVTDIQHISINAS
ncbi:MAG: hypothetical protein AAF579_14180 [Cyanobacteria bacterium P01_C01_bin.118]